jgi:hypothetical protein
MMVVTDFDGDHSVHSMAQLEHLLGVRFRDEQNLFHFSPDLGDCPALTIHVKADVAVIYYYPEDGHPGYVSLGGKLNLDPKESTTFAISKDYPETSIDARNVYLVPFSEAVKVAKEFFHSQELPRSIEWREL